MPEVIMRYLHATNNKQGELNLPVAQAPLSGAFSAMIARPGIFRLGLLALGGIIKANYNDFADQETWLARVLDPVVGVHPDGISFEAFSQDCSALGWVHFGNAIFEEPEVRQCGCTNIDFSEKLERYLQGLTSLSRVRLIIGNAEGVALEGIGSKVCEKKIDLPEEWIRGLGELHAGLLQSDIVILLGKADLFNILRAATKKAPQAMKGRALTFELKPGERVLVRVQPWDTVIRLQSPPPAIDEDMEIKIYGRRRLELLAMLLPHVESARLYLSGSSRPTYWELKLPGACIILGLSSWTTRKFTVSFVEALRGVAACADEETVQKAAAFLSDSELATLDELATAVDLTTEEAKGVGLTLCRRGLAVFEPEARNLRWRPLRMLPFAELGGVGEISNREENAARLLEEGKLELLTYGEREGLLAGTGRCQGSMGTYALSIVLNPDGSYVSAACECRWMNKNRGDLRGGPCKHLLALRAEVLKRKKTERERSHA